MLSTYNHPLYLFSRANPVDAALPITTMAKKSDRVSKPISRSSSFKLNRSNSTSRVNEDFAASTSDDSSEPDLKKVLSRISRVITACKRCRSRKIKCDKAFPRCGNCVKANCDECICVDGTTGESISRSYIWDIENQLTQLKSELAAMKKLQDRRKKARTVYGRVFLLKSEELRSLFDPESPADDEKDAPSRVDPMKTNPTDELPPAEFLHTCLASFFSLTNAQIPILNRDYYLLKYFKPLVGKLDTAFWKTILGKQYDIDEIAMESLNRSPAEVSAPKPIDPTIKEKCLFFLNIILAILTSLHQQKYPLSISDYYKNEAIRHIDAVWDAIEVEGSQNEEINKLEMLQSLLLLSQYSLMRPCTPGAWYLIGTSVRLCIDLGLYNDTVPSQRYMDNSMTSFVAEMKRRLFWCCYSLDRQISIYFNRPFSINEQQIDITLPSLLDDSQILPNFYKNQLKFIKVRLSSKPISLHFIKLRKIQSEIFNFIYDTKNKIYENNNFRNGDGDNLESANLNDENRVTKQISKFDNWKFLKHQELIEWFNNSPSQLNQIQYFNKAVFNLNFNQTLIQLYGISPITPMIIKKSHYNILQEAGKQIIQTYSTLQGNIKLINYSWVAINNIYLGASCYLYLIYNCHELKQLIDWDEIKANQLLVNKFLDDMSDICYSQATNCKSNLNILVNDLEKLYKQRQSAVNLSNMQGLHLSETASTNTFNDQVQLTMPTPLSHRKLLVQTPNSFFIDNEDFINNMVGSVNAVPSSFMSHDASMSFPTSEASYHQFFSNLNDNEEFPQSLDPEFI